MVKYKKFFDYETLSYHLKNRYKNLISINDIYNINIYDKLFNDKISKIIESLPENLINKIENINIEILKNEQKDKKEWNIKHIKYGPSIILKFITDFEIINDEIFQSLGSQKIEINNFLFGSYVFGDKRIFFKLTQ